MDLIEKNIDKFNVYYEFLTQENEKYNLTNITLKDDVFIKHFKDSISMANIYDLNQDISICDVGSGAGFPGIPLKICFPNIKLTIIEPTLKRCNFLKELCKLLDINDVVILNKRSEDISSTLEEKFDIMTARAVSNLSVLLELVTRMAKINGNIILYKGKNALDELNEASNCIKLLDLKYVSNYKYELDNDLGTHYLLHFIKEKKTNSKYPRRYSDIKKRPL